MSAVLNADRSSADAARQLSMASSESLADTGAGGDGLPASASGHLPNLITTIVGAVGELEANLAIEQPAAVKRSEADTTNTPPADAELSRRSLNPAVAVVHAAIARLRRAARVEDETFATASNFDDGDVPSEAAAAMRIAMAQAQREGRRARWRVQVPCIALGIVLIVVGCLLIAFLGEYALFGRIAMSAIATSAGATGVVLFLMAVIPADGNLVRLASIAVAFSLLIASALIAATSVVRRSGGVTTQCTAESTNFECQEAVLDVVTPALNMIALFVAGAASARATFLAQRQGTAPRALLEAVWRMLARFFAFGALVLLMRVAITASGRGAVSIYAAGNLVLGVWLLLLAAVLRYPSVRIRIQSVLAARGEALLTAAAVAAFMGNGVDPSELISRAQGSFRAVPLSLVQLEHLQSNEPDAALFALSAPVALGQCDCFVSHSWTDDAAKKHEALLSWGRRFEREFKRAPLIWLDRICLPQDRIEDSLQLLPCAPATPRPPSHRLRTDSAPARSRLWREPRRAALSHCRARSPHANAAWQRASPGSLLCPAPRARARFACACASNQMCG